MGKKVAVKPEPKVYWGSVDGSGGSWHSQPPAQTDWNKDGLDGLYKDGHGGALFCQSWSKPEEAPKRDPFLGYQEGWGAGKKAEKKWKGRAPLTVTTLGQGCMQDRQNCRWRSRQKVMSNRQRLFTSMKSATAMRLHLLRMWLITTTSLQCQC